MHIAKFRQMVNRKIGSIIIEDFGSSRTLEVFAWLDSAKYTAKSSTLVEGSVLHRILPLLSRLEMQNYRGHQPVEYGAGVIENLLCVVASPKSGGGDDRTVSVPRTRV